MSEARSECVQSYVKEPRASKPWDKSKAFFLGCWVKELKLNGNGKAFFWVRARNLLCAENVHCILENWSLTETTSSKIS